MRILDEQPQSFVSRIKQLKIATQQKSNQQIEQVYAVENIGLINPAFEPIILDILDELTKIHP